MSKKNVVEKKRLLEDISNNELQLAFNLIREHRYTELYNHPISERIRKLFNVSIPNERISNEILIEIAERYFQR